MFDDSVARILNLERALTRVGQRMTGLEARATALESLVNKVANPAPSAGGGGLTAGVTGAGFAAGSLASPSSQSVTLYMPTGNGVQVSAMTVTAYNVYSNTVAAGKTAFYTQDATGAWLIVTADC